MHPILTNRANFLLYIAAWAPLGIAFGLVLSYSVGLPWQESFAITLPVVLMIAFLCLSPWFACRFLPFGGTPIVKLLTSHLIAAVVVVGLYLLGVRMLASAISVPFPMVEPALLKVLPGLGALALFFYVLSVAFHYAFLALESSRRAEMLAREAELKALKAQVNPHFLFNSLNSISALTAIDSTRARDMCIRLSDFLRTSLRLGERASISFAEEWELTRTYLGVEQIRFGDRLRIVDEIEEECAGCDVPPLLVQPLVENAIKHGIATLVEGGQITISGKLSREGVRIVVDNPFDPEAPAGSRSGIGLRNVRDRLRARYGSAGRLEVAVERNHYRVTLAFPFELAAGQNSGQEHGRSSVRRNIA